MSKISKTTMKNLINVLTQVRDSKKVLERKNFQLRKVRMESNERIDPKEDQIESIDLKIEKQLSDELTCITNTTQDVSYIKRNKNL